MNMIRKLAMAGLTLSVAIAAGQYVQHGAADQAGAQLDRAPQPTAITLLSAGPAAAGTFDDAAPMPALPQPARLRLTPPEAQAVPMLPSDPETPAPQSTDACPITLDLAALPGAMLDLALTAPCHRDGRIVLRHAGLTVTARTDPDGRFRGPLPAMDRRGAVSVLLADGASVEAALPLADMAGLRRVAVQWLADDAFQIHADTAATETRLLRLGDASVPLPMQAEVFSFASGDSGVALEAAITEATCARELLGEVVESRDGRSEVTDLTVAMPGCDAVGGYLLLKNLPSDVSIAAAN